MTDRIELQGLRLLAVIGVLDHERCSAQPVEVDLTLHVDLADATSSDRLDDTIDYGALVAIVQELAAQSRDLLLERFAGRIADAALDFPRVEEAEVCVRKLRPPVPSDLDSAGVRLHRVRRGRGALDDAPHRVIVALGSNLGDRAGNLRLALRELEPVVAQSQVYETAPVGGPGGQDAYYNMVAVVDTLLDPFSFLRRCHRIEAAAERERVVHWGPRTLDVDILFYDDVRIDAPELVIPHPRLAQRRFVLAPLGEVAPTRAPEGWQERLEPLNMSVLGRVDLM